MNGLTLALTPCTPASGWHGDGLRTAMRAPCFPSPRGGLLKLHRGGIFGGIRPVRVPRVERLNPPFPETGTRNAIDYSNSGVAADSARTTGRGGARNRADRESHAVTIAQVDNLRAGTAYAYVIGRPFTRMITIHWEAAGIALADMAWATGRFIDLMTRALARHGVKIALVWTHEGGVGKGGHCHMLVHIPATLARLVARRQRSWLRTITGRSYRKGVIKGVPIGRRLGLEVTNPALHEVNLARARDYILKGASPEAAAQFDLERLEPGGRIIGKRCGVSQNIAATARSEGARR